jgi:hypothetical protein
MARDFSRRRRQPRYNRASFDSAQRDVTIPGRDSSSVDAVGVQRKSDRWGHPDAEFDINRQRVVDRGRRLSRALRLDHDQRQPDFSL